MVWLGHSLGCLLLKEVLRFDSQQPEIDRLNREEKLKGIIFYGGPHNVGVSLYTNATVELTAPDAQGSIYASALQELGGSISFSDVLRFHFQFDSPATRYLSCSSREDRERHEKLNKFFCDDSQIPFINFRESKSVTLLEKKRLRPFTVKTNTQIVLDAESNLVCPPVYKASGNR
jgi:hypothetical protein